MDAAGDYDNEEDASAAAAAEGYEVGAEGDNEAAASSVALRAVTNYGGPAAAATPGSRRGLAGNRDAAAAELQLEAEAAAAALECPGGSLTACVDVCPGNTAKIYAVCVQGCGNRCST